jgi:NitT/TauT family transport system ATP-binding protein
MLALKDISLSYSEGNAILTRLSISVLPGEIVCLVGRSGSGKTSLLKVAAGFIQPDLGRVYVSDIPVAEALRGQAIGYMWQEPSLLPWSTAISNVTLPLTLAKKQHTPDSLITLGRRALSDVGLAEWELSKPKQLSGGMAQRIALARALIASPTVLLLDEPFSAVDEVTRTDLLGYIRAKSYELQCATILVTHSVSDAMRVADRVVVLSKAIRGIAESFDLPAPDSATLRRVDGDVMDEVIQCLKSDC